MKTCMRRALHEVFFPLEEKVGSLLCRIDDQSIIRNARVEIPGRLGLSLHHNFTLNVEVDNFIRKPMLRPIRATFIWITLWLKEIPQIQMNGIHKAAAECRLEFRGTSLADYQPSWRRMRPAILVAARRSSRGKRISLSGCPDPRDTLYDLLAKKDTKLRFHLRRIFCVQNCALVACLSSS